MTPTIDYDLLLYSFVWASILNDLLENDFHFLWNAKLNIKLLLKYLPIARKYQSLAIIGQDMFKHQCYFITHFIYICSDWGLITLDYHLFQEEYNFILSNLNEVIALDVCTPLSIFSFTSKN